MNHFSRHAEWLRLVEVSGPFLAVPVLERAFPQGLDAVATESRQFLRRAHEEWREAVADADPQLPALHREWVRLVLEELLEYDRESLMPSSRLDGTLSYTAPGHGVTVTPDLAIFSGGSARMLVAVYPENTDLGAALAGDGWPVSAIERMTLLCRATGVRIGLITDGERWTMVNAPVGATSGHVTWYARFWWQEPVTLKAFQSLLGVRRCFGPAEETLAALLEESLQHQEEITDTLGAQVRRAVEVLIQSLDRADQDRNRELLRGVAPSELYEAGLTIMMRLVFVLCAEERGLLLLGDPVYDRCYAVSTLRAQLAEEAARSGQEVLERHHDAWSRLLAVFRAVYGGVEHENLRLPALGGSLFDPDRFPFLEGRTKGTSWRDASAIPLPIDNRTVLMLLTALQVLEQRGGALSLSYKALDVEQIGHVYEGLLEHTVAPLPQTTLGLVGSQKAKNPNAALGELESARLDGERALLDLLINVTGRSEPALRNALARELDDALQGKVLHACGGEAELAGRIYPFANLLRTDNWGDPLVYRRGAFAVTLGADRRETGTHYTPKSLTETIVETTLEPVVYHGPAEGAPREDWRLKSPAELLELKVCDPAMGSGAFLVQVCRWLAARVVEAWGHEEAAGKAVSVDGEVMEQAAGRELLPNQLDDRLLIARRLVAERCLYGVDVNHLAVELTKLSLWLTTMAKSRPFGFLDHNLRCGDSLLGIHRLDQLTELTMAPSGKDSQMRLFGRNVERAVHTTIELRQELREIPIRDIRDVQAMARLDTESRRMLEAPERVADGLVGEALRTGGNIGELETALQSLAIKAQSFLDGEESAGRAVLETARKALMIDLPGGKSPRKPFHWALEFPEVFARENGGFDAVTGNPPFVFGKNITAKMGKTYNDFLKSVNKDATSNVDLCAHFFVRGFNLLRPSGTLGLLATSSIAEGETRVAGLERVLKDGGCIYSARSKMVWPGKAAVFVSVVNIRKGSWGGGCILDGVPEDFISPMLTAQVEWVVHPLKANKSLAFVGVIPNGDGLFLTDVEYEKLIKDDHRNKDVLLPYITGSDLNSSHRLKGRHIINFWDWPLDKAFSYPKIMTIVEQRVRPHRLTLSDAKQKVKDRWWLFEASAKALFHALGQSHHFNKKPEGEMGVLTRAIAIARVSKTGAFTFVPVDYVFAAEVVVILSDDFSMFAVLQSSIHSAFAWNYAGKMKVDLRYSPTMCFEPFPFPKPTEKLRTTGKSYFEQRQRILEAKEIGLTKLYNDFHAENKREPDFQALRDGQVGMDNATLSAYGWSDIDLEHDYHSVSYLPANDRIRFTISERARIEVLWRLSELNRRRYEEEIAQGLHGKQSVAAARSRGPQGGQSAQATLDFGGRAATPESPLSSATKHRQTYRESESEYALAAEEQTTYKTGGESRIGAPPAAVIEFLQTHPGWHAKSGILAATGISDGEWNAAIADLLAGGLVERQGERRGARYRAISKSGGHQ